MTRNSKTLAIALLAGTALTTAAWAQFGGGPLVPSGGSAGMPMGGGPNRLGGNPFGMGRMPFASGTITAVDAAAGTITLTSLFDGQPQTVKVADATQITATQVGAVADLKVGDTIQVRGVPTGITASQITAGEAADAPMGGMGLPGPGGGPSAGRASAASAQATGRITSLSPLTVSVSDSVQVTLRMAPDIKISRNVTEKISSLKVGDRVTANGQAGADGVLSATRLRVNADYGLGFGIGQ